MPDVTLAGKAAATAEVDGNELSICQFGSVVTCSAERVRELLDQSDEGPVDKKGLVGEAEQHAMPNGERLSAYLFAMFHEGPLAGEWKDKPHRLVYDLVKEVLRLKEKAGE